MFGAKTVTVLVKEISEKPSLEAFEATGNASVRMNSTAALEKICEPLKSHKSIKKVTMPECEIVDDGCKHIAELLKVNNVIEELNLEKNKISSDGAKFIADALHHNKGLRTLNLMQQTSKNFGEDTLEAFCAMFHNNITLTKINWRLESRKSFMLNKLQTRNVEIKKRQDKGEDYTFYLPDHLRPGAEAVPAAAPAAAEATPAAAPAVVEAAPAPAPAVAEAVPAAEEAAPAPAPAVAEAAPVAEEAAPAPAVAEAAPAAEEAAPVESAPVMTEAAPVVDAPPAEETAPVAADAAPAEPEKIEERPTGQDTENQPAAEAAETKTTGEGYTPDEPPKAPEVNAAGEA